MHGLEEPIIEPSIISAVPTTRQEWWSAVGRVERLKELRDKGLSASQIANELGISRNAVIGKMHRLGWTTSRGGPEAEAARILRAAARHAERQKRYVQRTRVNVGAKLEPVPLEIEAPPPTAKPLLRLKDGECRWAYGEMPFLFCAQRTIDDSSYCGGHYHLVYYTDRRR